MSSIVNCGIGSSNLSCLPSPVEAGPSQREFTLSNSKRRLDDAVELLVQATTYAEQSQRDRWEYAVEISELWRLGVTTVDLRWLVCQGLVEHRRDVTNLGDARRTFRPAAELKFSRATCFVLSDQGVAQLIKDDSPAPVRIPVPQPLPLTENSVAAAGKNLPYWDSYRCELRVNGLLVKRYKMPRSNQETILMAFQEKGWPHQIADPLAQAANQENSHRLQDAIRGLNRNQKECRIRFRGDGTGKGVTWELDTSAEPASGS